MSGVFGTRLSRTILAIVLLAAVYAAFGSVMLAQLVALALAVVIARRVSKHFPTSAHQQSTFGGGVLLVVAVAMTFYGISSANSPKYADHEWVYFIFGGVVLGIVGVALLTLKKKESGNPTLAASASATTKKCKFCAETIQAEAKLCRFCNRPVEATET